MQHVSVDGSATRWVGVDYDVTVATGDLSATVEVGNWTCLVATGRWSCAVKSGPAELSAEHGVALLSGAGDLIGDVAGSVAFSAGAGVFAAKAAVGIAAKTQRGDIKLDAETGAFIVNAKSGEIDVTPGTLSLRAGDGVGVFADEFLSRTTSAQIEATEKLVLKCGTSTITLTPNKITLDAATITSTAAGVHTISGARVTIN